jgi:hypothetical protein
MNRVLAPFGHQSCPKSPSAPELQISESTRSENPRPRCPQTGVFGQYSIPCRPTSKQVGTAVSKWRDEAARHNLAKGEIDRMASAFEHDDLKMAQGGPVRRKEQQDENLGKNRQAACGDYHG